MTDLRTLDLSTNHLTKLPDEIGQLTNLQTISVSQNELTELPNGISRLANLLELDISYNRLEHFPRDIGRLSNLETLDASGNRIEDLPESIGQLAALLHLDVSTNRLTSLSDAIGQLVNLETLIVDRNRLIELPESIGLLANLQFLSFHNNQLTELPEAIGKLEHLRSLLLPGNQLTRLPEWLGRLPNLKKLVLSENPLPIPPTFLVESNNPADIVNKYLTQMHQGGRPLNEAKMLFVGQGGVGKTSLINRLVHDDFDSSEGKTQGIDVHQWNVDCQGENVRLNVWDFGGQEIMHATHQFFLTKRSLYVLVLDARQGEQESRIEYWVKLIQSFGGASPIIIVSNKSDQHQLDLDWTGLQRKYPSIRGFAKRVSCQTGEGISELRAMIEHEVARLEHVHDSLISSWFTVKSRLEEMTEDFIPYYRYEEMCHEEGIEDEISLKTLLGFLHDLGVVLHFDDHPPLSDTNILNPEWVTNGVYQIINSDILSANRGVLNTSDLPEILKPSRVYPREGHVFLIEMMRKFELCFEYPGQSNQRFLVPDLLPVEQPADTGVWTGSLAFEYHYDVLPGSVISRFIVGMSEYIFNDTNWRTGVVLDYEDSRNFALVRADLEDAKVFIQVSGNEATRRSFLGIIRADLDRIHRSISGLNVREQVPIPGNPRIVADYAHLLNLEEMGETTFVPVGLRERVNVKLLLDGIEPSEERTRYRRDRDRGDTYITYGDTYVRDQTGVMGRKVRPRDVEANRTEFIFDMAALADELSAVMESMKADARSPEAIIAIAEVGYAADAAREGDEPRIQHHLKNAGKFAWDSATKIAAEVAAAYTKSTLGL